MVRKCWRFIHFVLPKRQGGVTRNMSITEYPKNHHGISKNIPCFGNDKEWPNCFKYSMVQLANDIL